MNGYHHVMLRQKDIYADEYSADGFIGTDYQVSFKLMKA
jgi:hypothetical protein